MKKLTKTQIDKIISDHQHYLAKDCKGWKNMRADLYRADLREADLYGADLREADLRGADLRETDLHGADLREANLSWANLRGADLRGAKLYRADLYGADLREADLYGADLREADLRGAKLREADLRCADLYGTNLREADLRCADLEHADIYRAFFDAKEEIRKGIVLKKAIKGFKKTKEGVVITATIPAGAVVYSINGEKCRTNMATVTDMGGHKLLHSQYDPKFTYSVGKKILITDFDTRYNVECGEGFHFFRTRKEAENY